MIRLTLPIPVSSNSLFANRKRGKGKGRIPTKAYAAWIEHADEHFLVQKRSLGFLRRPYFDAPVDVTIKVPSACRKDVDNISKPICDYLVSREITLDDKHNRRVTVERDPALSGDLCQVLIEAAT